MHLGAFPILQDNEGASLLKDAEIKKIIGELDVHRLGKALQDAGFGPVPVVIGDLFAVGCYFLSAGRNDLGRKLCHTALSAYGIENSLLQRVLNHVEEHPEEMAQLLNPHVEVPGWLFAIAE